jgi:precorrin-8X/cobalt-precorrin-8 methylmutase
VTTSRRGHDVHPIEAESYRILRSLVDLSHLPPLSRAVAERVIHASAELGWAEDLVLDEAALERGRTALAAGAPVVADVGMVAAGLHGLARSFLRDPRVEALAAEAGITRSAAGIRLAAGEVGPGAVWAIGSAPTALEELLRLDAAPALVIGLPVGFVGAVESKAALRASGLPALTNRGPRGGSPVAAAAVNALRRLAGEGG